jgi:hypothetical protein
MLEKPRHPPTLAVLRGSDTRHIIKHLSVDPVGEITEPNLAAALQGVDTVVHMAYEVDPCKRREGHA